MIKVLCVLLVICETIYAEPPYSLFANSSDEELVLLGKKFDEFAVLLEQVLTRHKGESPEISEDTPLENAKLGSLSSSSENKVSLLDRLTERIRNRLTSTKVPTTTTTTGSSTAAGSTATGTTLQPTTATPPA